MPRAGTGRCVQLYDVTRTRVIRQLSLDELNRLAAQGLIGYFARKSKSGDTRNFPCMQPIPMQSRTSDPIRSKIPLVGTDMELNAEGAFADKAGIGGIRKFGLNRFGAVDESIIGNRVDQSMSKVEAWPKVFDHKNVTVCAGRVHGLTVAELS